MANSTRLARWGLSNADKLDLKVSRFTWPNTFHLPWFDIEVRIRISAETFVGRGTALTEADAFDRALAESLERAVWKYSGTATTNGFAAGQTYEFARSKAASELIERDSFLCHFLTSTPFLPVAATKFAAPKLPHGLELQVKQMMTADPYKAFTAITLGSNFTPPFGVIVGLGCSTSEEDAISSATRECMRQTAAWLDGTDRTILTMEEFLLRDDVRPRDHGALARWPAYTGLAEKVFKEKISESDFNNLVPLRPSEIVTEDLQPRQALLASSPLYFCQSTCLRSQKLFFGQTRGVNLNHSRLRTFCSRSNMVLSSVPHPLS